jgi:hypothetical protein
MNKKKELALKKHRKKKKKMKERLRQSRTLGAAGVKPQT